MVKIIKCSNCGEYKPGCAGYCGRCYQNIRNHNRVKNAPLKRCECGDPLCTEIIPSITNIGTVRKVAKGHENRGHKPHNFKGYTIHKQGYIACYAPDHPYCTKHTKQVMEHRLIYEHYLYIMFDEHIYIPKYVDIHHINGIKDDNSLINLTPLYRPEHTSITSKNRDYDIIDTSKRFCNLCGGHKTAIRKGRYRRGKSKRWHLDINGYLCHWCYEVIRDCRKKFGLPTSGY